MTPEEKVFKKNEKCSFFLVGFSQPEYKHIKANLGNYQLRNVSEVKDADEAWEKLDLSSHHFILLNVDTPNGGELLENMVDSHRFTKTPIFVFSKSPDFYQNSYSQREMIGRFNKLPVNLNTFEKELMVIMVQKEFEKNKIGGMSEGLNAYTKGCKAYADGKLEEAKDLLRLALKHDQKFVDGYIKLAFVLIDQEDYNMAGKVLEIVLKLDPKNSKIFFVKGVLESRQDNREEARKMFDKALEIEPKNVNLIVDIGNTCLDSKWLDEAIHFFNTAKKTSPDFLYIYNRLGIALTRAGRYEEAGNEYDLALKIDDKDAGVHFNIGMLWQRQKENDKAIEYFKKTLELDSTITAAKDMIEKLTPTA